MADKAEIARRFGTLALAGLFLVTSVAFTGIIFWQSRNESSNPDANEQQAIQNALDQQNQTGVQGAQEQANMLQGTQLANFTPTSERIGELQITDTIAGTGEEAKAGATVTAHYTGALVANGIIFQSSHDMGQAIPFGLDQVISGWTEGVPGMKVGGTRRLVIPAAKAYGPAGSPPSIPADADLVFDIELVEVKNQ